MRRWQQLMVVLLFGGSTLHSQMPLALEANDSCEAKWEDLSKEYVHQSPSADYGAALRAWKGLESTCDNSPRYRARLALIYFYLDQPKASKEALATVSREEEEGEPLVTLVRILADAALLRDSGASQGELEEIEERLRAYALKNPRDAVGVTLLGDVLNDLGRYEAAAQAYVAVIKAMGMSARSVGVMRNLTITYEQMARHEDAYRLAGEVISYDRAGLTSDLYFMCAVARAQASLGRVKGARDTLTLLANKNAEVREHPDFKAAVAFVKEKMRTTPVPVE
jgi:tetratricopeptide (TPR) repeat protein